MCCSQYLFLLVAGSFCVYCLWKAGPLSWQSSSVRAKASIQFDLSIPASSSSSSSVNSQRFLNKTKRGSDKGQRKYRGTLSRYMLDLYHRRPDADVVRAIQPIHVSTPSMDGARILVFSLPSARSGETLELAELLGTAGAILRVRSPDRSILNEKTCTSRRDESWRAFNVTSVVVTRTSHLVKLRVYGRVGYRPCGDVPILLLSYNRQREKRSRRSVQEEEQEETGYWEDEGPRRRRRNSCRRRPLYVDFALIAYDEWVVAPPGYEAYQCVGKCFYPFGDHLSPTKHAIVQTLVHGALQATEGFARNKAVGRACCVPTRLAPTSLLYLDASGTLTYQYGYEDMVVVECGCR